MDTTFDSIRASAHPALVAAIDLLRPSEHTAALIQALHRRHAAASGASVLEIGSGSGVVLACLAQLGAAELCGVDIEADALQAGPAMLDAVGGHARAEFIQGDMWSAVPGRRFDLIVSNLPQFPTKAEDFPGRLRSWSDGGEDGRALVDRFIGGLAAHLAPGGRAIMTHNAFIDMAKTRRVLSRDGLRAQVLQTDLVVLPADKFSRMTNSVRLREEGKTILTVGPYTFARIHIIEISAKKAKG